MTAALLAERLRRQIQADGPMTFADFMEAALYDQDEGFYSRNTVGEQGDFVTSPHVSPVFGVLVARQISEFWEVLGRPAEYSVVEVGAGSGLLAGQVLAGLRPELLDRTEYVAVERSDAGRNAIRELVGDRVTVAADLGQIGPDRVGCVVANELLDNLPFHRVRGTREGNVELFVESATDSRFVLVEGQPSAPVLAAGLQQLAPGHEAVVGVEAAAFIDRAASTLAHGFIWLCDYGWSTVTQPTDLVHGYQRHRVEEDVLADPGSRDITAGVDFGDLKRRALARGLPVWGPVTQRDALLALGFRELDEEARAAQVRATAARDGVQALRIYSDRNRASLLVDPAGLGRFLVMCIGVGVNPERVPQSVRSSELSARTLRAPTS
jgi:SAM-dependent MidA family methyltransferase